MTLTFRDSVTVRLCLTSVFAGAALIIGPIGLLILSFQYLGLTGSSLATLIGLGVWIALLAVALTFDWFGVQRMGKEKSLSVSRINFEPEYLRLTGHTGWQFHYARQGISLSKETRTEKNGKTSYYLMIRAVEEKQPDVFFIGYDEKEVDGITATLTATDGSSRLGEPPAPTPWEDYFPLPAYLVAVLLLSLCAVFIDVLCVNGFLSPGCKNDGIRLATFAGLGFLATAGSVCLIIKHLTRATGIWITETALRAGYTHEKTVTYPYACHVLDEKWITGRGQSACILQVWKNGKRIKKFQLGGDEDRVVCEMVFRKLTTARQKALHAGSPGEC